MNENIRWLESMKPQFEAARTARGRHALFKAALEKPSARDSEGKQLLRPPGLQGLWASILDDKTED